MKSQLNSPMKKAGKIFIYLVIVLIVVIGAVLSYVKFGLPDVGEAPNLKVELTPERIERGKYLANKVTVCIDCHSTRDWSRFSGPLDPNGIGTGGEKFDHNIGFPGEVYVPNITPHNLKTWTDGELFRAITSGVKKDGSAIFPIMPYNSYNKMDKEDIYSIIAYIRTLPSKATSSPKRKLDFPLNFLVNTMPVKPNNSQAIPSGNDEIAYGAYLVTSAACRDCHTKQEKGKVIEGMDFAGGYEFKLPVGTVTSANITPEKETGIGSWTKEQFIERFKSYQSDNVKTVGKSEFQTVMPWTMYGGMKEKDLEAIYAYLQTLKPIKNHVTKFAPLVVSR
jgi:mono/diheme cytochrome c family protein